MHLYDLMNISTSTPEFRIFREGNFTFQKSNSGFSNNAFDQVREWKNAAIKEISGVSHLLNKQTESALLHCELCLTITEPNFEIGGQIRTRKNHEDIISFRMNFVNDFTEVFRFAFGNDVRQNSKSISSIGET